MLSSHKHETMTGALQPAYVLHLRPYRESSAIVDLLYPEGRISCVAKGIRGKRKSAQVQRANLQPFQRLLCSWSGRSELKSLTKFEGDGLALHLQGDILLSGLYINELLTKIYHGSAESQDIFHLYELAIASLSDLSAVAYAKEAQSTDSSSQMVQIVLRSFEFGFLEKMGYGINFSQDAETGQPIEASQQSYRYVQEKGFVATQSSGGGLSLSGNAIVRLMEALRAKKVPDAQVLRDAKKLSRSALTPLLGGKVIETRKLFNRHS